MLSISISEKLKLPCDIMLPTLAHEAPKQRGGLIMVLDLEGLSASWTKFWGFPPQLPVLIFDYYNPFIF